MSPSAHPGSVDLSFGAGGALAALLSGLAAWRTFAWWRRRRDAATLVHAFAALNLALLSGIVAVLLARWDDLRAHALVVLGTYAWTALLAWEATRFAARPGSPPGAVVGRATLAGLLCGPLVLLGVGVALSVRDGIEALILLLVYGLLPAAVIGGAFGFVLGLVDALLLRRLTRGARSP